MSSPAPIWEQLLNTAKDFMDEKKWGIKADNAILTPPTIGGGSSKDRTRSK